MRREEKLSMVPIDFSSPMTSLRISGCASSAFNSMRSSWRNSILGPSNSLPPPLRHYFAKTVQHHATLHAEVARHVVGDGHALQPVRYALHRRHQELKHCHLAFRGAHVV